MSPNVEVDSDSNDQSMQLECGTITRFEQTTNFMSREEEYF